jgi:hypothetical protein
VREIGERERERESVAALYGGELDRGRRAVMWVSPHISFLSCFIWGSKRNCNTEMVQSTATLNTVLVKKIT